MRFLAIAIGVHTIDNLVLKDIETGESINLRYVIVDHDRMPFLTDSSQIGHGFRCSSYYLAYPLAFSYHAHS